MPSNIENVQVIIRADRALQTEHRGHYNAPQVDEVAVLIVGQEFTKRDIVLRARDNTLKHVSEIHRSYDALQYPLIFSHGEDGYSINVPQVHTVTRVPKKKLCEQWIFTLTGFKSEKIPITFYFVAGIIIVYNYYYAAFTLVYYFDFIED